jgi:tripartite-type tricarboxylate transporter receptor subunit TctC
VPLALDLATSDEARRIMELVFAPQAFARPFAAPPDLPEGRAALLRAAFAATMKDAEFLADAEKQKLDIEHVPGEDIEAMLAGLYRTPPAVIARARAAIGRK